MVSGGVGSIGRCPALVSLLLAVLLALGGCPKRRPPKPAPEPPVGASLLPDLVAAGAEGLGKADVLDVTAGSELMLGPAVRNEGAPADPPIVVKLVLSPSRIVDPDAIVVSERTVAVPVGAGQTVKLPVEPVVIDAPDGDWTLIQVVESGVEEVFGSNNIAALVTLRIRAADQDGDGLSDALEFALARAFAPDLLLHPEEDCPERRPAWAVRPIFGGASIFYALNWERDCGLPLGRGMAAHLGDAEFVVVDLVEDADLGWEVQRIFLSAHYRSGEGRTRAGALILDHSGWFAPEAFGRGASNDIVLGGWHPQVVVARHKHANFASVDDCRLSYDSCAAGPGEPLAVRADRNLGSREVPVHSEIVDGDATEWFWRGPLPFCGWQVASLVLADRSGCAGVRNSWFEQLTAWQEERL
mgnify:FL=1